MAKMLGNVTTLRPGEVEMAGQINAMPTATFRTWEYWSVRLEKSGNGLPRSGKKSVGTSAKRASVARTTSKKAKAKAKGRNR
jgi:HCOMODA/2-hydroxy-3-carboxy-muconic semialdehyde decarboxylase